MQAEVAFYHHHLRFSQIRGDYGDVQRIKHAREHIKCCLNIKVTWNTVNTN